MASSPLVSVLIPCFNSSRYIEKTIKSVQKQTITNWELLLIDDASTDDSRLIAECLQKQDARIHIISAPSNLGPGGAMRLGLSRAQGKYGARLDADDVALPQWLETRLKTLQANTDLVAVSGSRVIINSDGAEIGSRSEAHSPRELEWSLKFGNSMVQPGAVFIRSSAIHAGGYPDWRYYEDWCFFRRIAREGGLLQTSDHIILYRVHANNTSKQQAIKWTEIAQQAVDELIESPNLNNIEQESAKRIRRILFRGRAPIAGTSQEVNAAIQILHEEFREFRLKKESRDGRLAEYFLRDVANVCRCGEWSVSTVATSLRIAGLPSFSNVLPYLRQAAILILLPIIGKLRS